MNIPKPSHPTPIKKRAAWMNLNGNWQFSLDTPAYDRTILVPFPWGSPMSGIPDDRPGVAYYRRSVCYSPANDRLFLIVGACDYSCTVSVNGTELGTHLGGYAPFEVEVSKVWKNEGENIIEIKAEDRDDESYQTYGKQGYGNIRGIWQTVYLEERPESYIREFTVRTRITGDITVDFEAEGDFDYFKASFAGKDYTTETNRLSFKLDEPRLWTPDEPNLYEGTLTLIRDGKEDTVETYFGVREVGAVRLGNGRQYVALNGKPIYVNSTLDQSFNPWGFFTLKSDEEEENEILRLKKIGLNSARIHIKTEEPLKLYYADKHGLMIIQDIPCFWGEPVESTRKLFDEQMTECMKRDINHPAIVHWVLYNETWGLFTHEGDKKEYTKETQEWVRANYKKAKTMDPTRLVEDNSPCCWDHVETDIDTWHFYYNGYGPVKEAISSFAEKSTVGTEFNYIGGNRLTDVPLMNSECGNVWGIDGNAGDSDMAWHYHYMLNQFRLTEVLSGFVFTEFHDVVNEFNGYYRIDNTQKVYGYEAYVPGMSMKDLHSQDFLAYDMPPMTTVKPGDPIRVPLMVSSFTDLHHNKTLTVRAELSYTDEKGTEHLLDSRILPLTLTHYGLTRIGEVDFKAPSENAVAVVRLYLCDRENIIMRNFVTFDVEGENKALKLADGKTEGHAILCQQGEKLNLLDDGKVTFEVDLSDADISNGVEISFEASARETFTHDLGEITEKTADNNYMLGYKVDRGANKNCYFMTDEVDYPSNLTLKANGKEFTLFLHDDPADSRGCLSWHYQVSDRALDEAGSYGYLYSILLDKDDVKDKKLTLTFQSDKGFALYGRKSGRYPLGLTVKSR